MTRRTALMIVAGGGTLLAAGLPRPAGDLTVTLPDGKKLTVAGLKGKPLVLGLILTTCPHCQHLSRVLSKVHADLAGKALSIVLGALDPDGDVPAFIKKSDLKYPVGRCDYAAARSFMVLPADKLSRAPWLVFIDQQGQIRQQFTGSDDYFFPDDDKQMENNIRMILDPMLAKK